jgi:NitT/TauT family transport system substrate-binding protein
VTGESIAAVETAMNSNSPIVSRPRNPAGLAALVAALMGMAATPVLLAATTEPASAQNKLEAASLRLDWLASGYHVPFFYALERGFYRDQGIDLTIADGKGSTTTLQVVASGNETFGATNLSTMALGIAKGMPVVAVAALIQKSPDAILSLKDGGIARPKDIEGKRGAFVSTSASTKIFPAFAKAAGINTDKVTKLQIEGSARYSVLLQGNADFVLGWSFTDNFKINKHKPTAEPILFADSGVNILGIGLVVSKETLKQHSSLVKRFLAATVKGIDEAVSNPKAAIDATMKVRPNTDREALADAAMHLKPFLRTKHSENHPYGWMAKEDWEQSKQILVQYLGLSVSISIDSLYTNAYLPQQ